MQVTLGIRGMSCNHCVMSVTQALKKLPGIAGVQVSLQDQQAVVDYDESQVDLPRMKAAIDAIGFEVV